MQIKINKCWSIKMFSLLVSLLILQSCGISKNKTFWVSGIKTECTAGAGKMECLNIYRGDDISKAKWENFYVNIEGFEFEEGFLKKIEVKEEQLKNVPADASTIKYTMIKELEKQLDYRTLLDGNWVLNRLNDNPIDRSVKLPEMEIRLKQMQVRGTSGCNTYSTKISKLATNAIKFCTIVSTKKACISKNIEQKYFETLSTVETYQIKGENLTFYNEKGEKIVSYMKKVELVDAYKLHDIWTVIRIAGNPINRMSPIPRMELNLTTMRVLGNNSCNDYTGEIKEVSDTLIVFGNMATTKKMCRKMDVAVSFDDAISKVTYYKSEGLHLIFFNNNEEEVLAFLKGD
jgi:heat shock protein HslJ